MSDHQSVLGDHVKKHSLHHHSHCQGCDGTKYSENTDGFLICGCDICGNLFSQPSKLKEHELLQYMEVNIRVKFV